MKFLVNKSLPGNKTRDFSPSPPELKIFTASRAAAGFFCLLSLGGLALQLIRGKIPILGSLGWQAPGLVAAGLLLASRLSSRGKEGLSLVSRLRSRATIYGLGLAFFSLLGLILRFYPLGSGLPYIIPSDESLIVDAGTFMLKNGTPDPKMFYYPSLYVYLQTLVYALHFLYGAFGGIYTDLTRDWPDKTYDITTTPGVYVWGRSLTALFGTISIPLLYLLVKKIWQDRRMALVAAGLVACSALAIENSAFISVDIPLALLLTLALWPAWRIAEEGHTRDYLIFGCLAGLATSIKWNGGLILSLGLLAHFLHFFKKREPGRLLNLNPLWMLLSTGVAALLTTPFFFAELRGFTEGFLANLDKYVNSNGSKSNPYPWLGNLEVLWNDSPAVALLLGGGLLLACFRHTRRDVLLLFFPLVYLVSINNLRLIYPRTVLPLTYYGAILAALFISWLYEASKKAVSGRQGRFPVLLGSKAPGFLNLALPVGLVLLLMYSPLRNAAYSAWFNAQPYSYARAGEWLEQNAGPGPLKLAELRPQQWPKGFSNLLAVRDDPGKFGNQGDAHPLEYYRERGIAYLALNRERAAPFLQSGSGNYFDIFSKGKVLSEIETRGVEKPGPPFTIISSGVTPETLKLQHPLPQDFQAGLKLLGFNLGKLKGETEIYLPPEGPITGDWPSFKPGEIIGLSVYWQPTGKLDKDYIIFIHLVPENQPGTNLAARDTPPLQNNYPTSRWKPGEILADEPNLALPPNLPPGNYNLLMGLYVQNADSSFTPLLTASGEAAVKLGTVAITR